MRSTYWRWRIAFTDRPGGLADVAGALATVGADILDLDVHLLASSDIADDVVVELPYWAEPTSVEHALRAVGATTLSARRIDPHELVDRQVRLLETVAHLAATDATDRDLAAALGSLLHCESVWLGPAGTIAPHGVAAVALAGGQVVVGRERLQRLGPGDGSPPWTLAVPWGADRRRVAVVTRRDVGFTSTEIARVGALLGVASAVRDRRVGTVA